MEDLFELKEGAVLTVPPMSVKQDSVSRRRHNCPGTPKVLRLGVVKRNKDKLFFIKTLDDDTRRAPEDFGGKVLFSPGNVSPGDQLRITWVDPNCACAQWAN